MIVFVKDPKSTYVCQSKFGLKETDNQWYASCLNPNYITNKPNFDWFGRPMTKIYESEHEAMMNTERLYFHQDGKWRTTCMNEDRKFTAYFENKEDLIKLLGETKYEER
jgi:hypothetical protein